MSGTTSLYDVLSSEEWDSEVADVSSSSVVTLPNKVDKIIDKN